MSRALFAIPTITVVGYGSMIFFYFQSMLMAYCIIDTVIKLSAVIIEFAVYKNHKYEAVEN